MPLVVLAVIFAIEVEIDHVSGALVVTFVIDLENGFALEWVVTQLDPASAQTQRNFVELVEDSHSAVFAHRPLDPCVEKFVESLMAEFELAEVL